MYNEYRFPNNGPENPAPVIKGNLWIMTLNRENSIFMGAWATPMGISIEFVLYFPIRALHNYNCNLGVCAMKLSDRNKPQPYKPQHVAWTLRLFVLSQSVRNIIQPPARLRSDPSPTNFASNTPGSPPRAF